MFNTTYIYFFLKLSILGAVNTAKVPKTQFPFDISLVLRRTQKGQKASLHYKSYIRFQRLDFTSFNLKNDLSSVKVETGNVAYIFRSSEREGEIGKTYLVTIITSVP